MQDDLPTVIQEGEVVLLRQGGGGFHESQLLPGGVAKGIKLFLVQPISTGVTGLALIIGLFPLLRLSEEGIYTRLQAGERGTRVPFLR